MAATAHHHASSRDGPLVPESHWSAAFRPPLARDAHSSPAVVPRLSANLDDLKDRLIAAGMLTTNQIVAKPGIDRSTVIAWRSTRRLKGRVCSDRGEWLYWPPDSPMG